MSTPLNPPPPNCTERPFHAVGRLTWNLIGGACGSTEAMAPSTRQCSGNAGRTPISGGGGAKGGGEAIDSSEAGTSTADSIVAPADRSPMAVGAIGATSRAHASAGVGLV